MTGQFRRRFGVAVAGCAALAMASCATIKSDKVSSYQAGPAAAGLTYFLPMRMVKLTVTRAPVDLAELTKKRDGKVAELTAAKALAGEAKTKREQAVADLTAFKPDPADQVASDRAKAQLTDAVSFAKTRETSIATAVTTLTNAVANFNLDIAAAQTGAVCSYTAKLELLPAQPDPSQRYVAKLAHNPLRDDTATLRVTPSGLLSSANIVAADRTDDLIVEAAGALAATGAGGGDSRDGATDDDAVPCSSLPQQFVAIFDPIAGATVARPKKEIDGLNATLKENRIPFRVEIDTAAVNALLAAKAIPAVSEGSKKTDISAESGALFYRSPIPILLTLKQKFKEGSWYQVDAAIIMLPQAGPVSYIPLESSAFVKTVDDVQFVDGSIASWSPDRPSEVLEIVRLPIKILTAVISVPAQIVSLRVDLSTKEASLAEKQKAQIEADYRIRALKLCLDRAAAAGQPASSCS